MNSEPSDFELVLRELRAIKSTMLDLRCRVGDLELAVRRMDSEATRRHSFMVETFVPESAADVYDSLDGLLRVPHGQGPDIGNE